jgi:hypothetical protein
MPKGKNFSCNNLGQRRASDVYETPYSLTRLLIEAVGGALVEPILEPATGNGAIVKVLKEFGMKNIVARDKEVDFLKREETQKFCTIITNPPFSLADEFIEKAMTIAPTIYMLLPLSYLHGVNRYRKFYTPDITGASHRLTDVYVFTRYPLLGDPLREDGKTRTGMMVYAWFVFKNHSTSLPVIRWLDNNPYILKKGE